MDGFMQRRRDFEARMKRECIWSAVAIVLAFAALVACLYVYGGVAQ